MVPDVVCNINKRKRVCLSHDCPVRSFDVTSKKWEWIVKSKKYGWVSRKNKKYVCESVRPVQSSSNYTHDSRKQRDRVEPVCDNFSEIGAITGDNRLEGSRTGSQ